MIHIKKKEYLLELRNLLDSMRKDDRDAVLNMAASCFDAAESDEEAVVKLGRPMAAARRLLKSYEPGCYAEMFAEEPEKEAVEVEDEAVSCEQIDEEEAEETAETKEIEETEETEESVPTPEDSETSRVDGIYADVFGLEQDKSEEEISEELLSEESLEQEAAPEESREEPQETEAETDSEQIDEAQIDIEADAGEDESHEEAAIEIARAVEERMAHEQRAEKEGNKPEEDEKPQYSVIKIIGYSIPAIALGVPVAIFLVALSLVFVMIGAVISAAGALIVSFVFLNMSAISDILMTAGAGLAVLALGALIIVFSIYFFGKYSVGFINRVFEGGAKNCLKDRSKYRAPIVEEESLGLRIMRTVSAILLSFIGLGILSFLFSMILGADIKRIAGAIFAKYDLAAVIRYLINTFDVLKAFIFR